MPRKSTGRPRGRPRKDKIQSSDVAKEIGFNDIGSSTGTASRLTLRTNRSSRRSKRELELENDLFTLNDQNLGSHRSSQRLAKKDKVNLYVPSSDEDESDKPRARKHRRLSKKDTFSYNIPDSDNETIPIPKTKDTDQDWELQTDSDATEDLDIPNDFQPTTFNPEDEDDLDLPITPPPTKSTTPRNRTTRQRLAAITATQKLLTTLQSPPKPSKSLPPSPLSHNLLSLARTYPPSTPAFLNPQPLSRNRLTIDSLNVILYAEEDAIDPWASAYAYDRYRDAQGNACARKHVPFRELHRLSEPRGDDVSVWAENIRWAREQWRVFGSVWTECGGSLEVIEEWRVRGLWVSEEVLRAGM